MTKTVLIEEPGRWYVGRWPVQDSSKVLRSLRKAAVSEPRFVSLSISSNEVSLVAPAGLRIRPRPKKTSKNWSLLRFEGTLDFALVGVLARLTKVLAEASISVFVVSTYDTDFVLLKAKTMTKARRVLLKAGYALKTGKRAVRDSK